MPGFEGRLSNVGLGKEGTWGTAVGATVTLPLASADVWETPNLEAATDLHAGGGGVTARREETARDVGGSIESLLAYETLGLLLEAGIGTNSSGAGPPYTHTITHGDHGALPGLTLRGKLGSTSHVYVLSGCMVNVLKLMWKAREFAKIRCEFIGKAMDSLGAGSPGTPTVPALVLPHQAGSFSWNSVSYTNFTEVEVEINNNLSRTPVLGSLYTGLPQPSARRTVRVRVTGRLSAAEWTTLQANCVAGTRSNFTFTFSGASSRAFAVTVHNAQIVETPKSALSSHGPVTPSWTLEATDDGSGNDGISVAVTNGNSSYSS